MRSKTLAWNTLSSLLCQVVALICGFIVPKLLLQRFGSEVYGLVSSITQFLALISFMEFGVGAVVQSTLYRPLASKDDKLTSRVIASANRFFKRLACVLVVYIVFLVLFYPRFVNRNFSSYYTSFLIVAISIGTFVQYYFGVVDRILLIADQKGYVYFIAQTITLVLNALLCVQLIHFGCTIHFIKLASSLIFLLRPAFLRYYINRNYRLNRKIEISVEPITQKWNGVAQHVASVVLDGTDSIVLTILTTLTDVSIYSVYHLVIYGVKTLFLSLTNGIQALLGELWAKQELGRLKQVFGWTEWGIHTAAVFAFGCTGILILPFVRVYTANVNDAIYIQPLFAALITLAHAAHVLRLPYNMMILAGGHYKQTQSNYIMAALINIVLSIITVRAWGLVGVAFGTLISMIYQIIWMYIYISKNLIKWPVFRFIKQLGVDLLTVIVASIATRSIPMNGISYLAWVILAAKVAFIWIVVIASLNTIFFWEKIRGIIVRVIHRDEEHISG